MAAPIVSTPPVQKGSSYIVDQLEGERVSIPGSKGTFRILASSKQTEGGIAVFTSGAVLSDAPGFHWHAGAHDIFLVTKGYVRLWNGDKCKVLAPGDFAYVPPKVIHNPELLGPHTETLGLVAPGDWVDFFRYIGETYNGLVIPEHDDRDLKAILIPKVMAAKDKFDVNFVRDYQPPAETEWDGTENQLPAPLEPYFLRANTGPRWLLDGVMSRPFIHAEQCSGLFAISSIESSKLYEPSQFTKRRLRFDKIAHCFCVQEGLLKIRLGATDSAWSEVREGQTLLVAAGQSFSLDFGSRYVRAITFTNGPGIEQIIKDAGSPTQSFVLPEKLSGASDDKAFEEAAKSVGAVIE